MSDIGWIVLVFYVSIWAIGGYFIWKAYQLGLKKNFKYATGPWRGKLKNPAMHLKHLAVIELFTGISILAFAVAIPLLKIELRVWGPVFTIIGMTRLSRQLKIARQNET
jgi:hypothetical protein